MATLTLNMIWINRLDNGLAASGFSTSQGQTWDMVGEVRTYAGGRQRAFTQAGERGQYSFTLRGASLTTKDLLRTWEGVAVQVRDHRGQRYFGTFFEVRATELKGAQTYDVAIVLRVITAVEGV